MTAELLSQERAKALLMAYGAEPERWPPEWREPLILALANDPVLQEYAAVRPGSTRQWSQSLWIYR